MAECEIYAHLRDGATSDRPARGPLLWEQAGAEDDPSPDTAFPPTTAFEFDQRLAW